MEYAQLLSSLSSLDPYEQLGKQFYLTQNRNLSYSQYIYLRNFPPDGDSLRKMMEPSAIREQQRIRKVFQTRYNAEGLTEQDFLPEERNLEIEKLLRYVDIPKHRHGFVECAYVFSGSCLHVIDDREYLQEEGSLVFIPVGTAHTLYSAEDCLCLTIKMRHHVFSNLEVPDLIYFVSPTAFQCGGDSFVRDMILSIYAQQEEKLPYSDQIMEQLYRTLLLYVMQKYRNTMQFLAAQSLFPDNLLEIMNYAMDNYQTITLQSLANAFHYNPSYLSRMFHEQTGSTFSAALREFKLNKAAQLLLETEMSLNDICDAIGYKDTTQFIRSFKSLFGTTPNQYRKKFGYL